MEIIKVNARLTNEERETVLVFDNIDRKWHADTTLMKHANKLKKQGWDQVSEYVYEDGTVCGGEFIAPEKGITIRDPNKKRVMNESQMKNLRRCNDEEEDDED